MTKIFHPTACPIETIALFVEVKLTDGAKEAYLTKHNWDKEDVAAMMSEETYDAVLRMKLKSKASDKQRKADALYREAKDILGWVDEADLEDFLPEFDEKKRDKSYRKTEV